MDPILRDIFSHSGYFFTPYGPEGTHRLRDELNRGEIQEPFYHWTHDPVETFSGLIGNPAYRFIFMHRDPRDAAVSWAHDLHMRRALGEKDLQQVLEVVVEHIQPPHVKAAVEWIRSDCMTITFKEMVQDMKSVIQRILDHVGYFDADFGERMSDTEIQRTIAKYSFEAVAGRKRGETGETIRTGYMVRKGVSGEWKTLFPPELLRRYDEKIGREIELLGYPPSMP
ncbi:MAG: sulfotransferase domain-containing protein [Candidatus Accumulibacter sp.]|uniref:sulfotransferase domain-containing protein n=1 Tax=Accumulibacter sp. TaxID=2053492 RepID=UPI00287A4E37|nr:sulfotransferase domain-containing protein [Accumulibacter sp.]MDS4013423.1 sulfotransferase domain-containing protein [Accumulibacter sp.]